MKLIYGTVLIFLCSCASFTPDKISNLATMAGNAAAAGAQLWLMAHPEQRPAFDAVATALGAFLANGGTDEAKFVEKLSSLPTATLAGKNSELYVSEPHLVVYDNKSGTATRVEGEALAPVMKATARGLRRAMVPQPPKPTKKRHLEL